MNLPHTSNNSKPQRIKTFLVGGGTGGHIYPLLALLKTLPDPRSTLLITGSRPIELKILAYYPYPWLRLPLKRVTLKGKDGVLFLWNLLRSFVLTLYMFFRHRPSQVITTGAYISLPAAILSVLLRKPLYLIEPNSTPGRTAHLLHYIALKIVTADPRWIRRQKTPVFVGAPVRVEFKRLPSPSWRTPHTLLIVGGSQGSELFNRILPGAFKPDDPLEVIHIVGSESYSEVRARYPKGLKVEFIPYADEIWKEMERAQIVIARAGASTISELIAARRPAIVVPFPFAGAHQLANARFFSDQGGGRIVEEGPDFLRRLRQTLWEMLAPESYTRSVQALEKAAAHYDAEKVSQWLGLA